MSKRSVHDKLDEALDRLSRLEEKGLHAEKKIEDHKADLGAHAILMLGWGGLAAAVAALFRGNK